jgi:hypothetical protein
MHNCKETKEQITELLLDGAECSPDAALPEELRRCAECRGEFDALSATLRITTRLREAAAPKEAYWTSYHANLRQKLFHAKAQKRRETQALFFASLRLGARSVVPVPVPVCAALLVIFSILSFFAMRGIRSQKLSSPNPAVVHVPVEVPVVQEKIVTRVVYRERWSRKSQQTIAPARVDSTMTLAGFKPTDEIKFTVIKGGSSNEK